MTLAFDPLKTYQFKASAFPFAAVSDVAQQTTLETVASAVADIPTTAAPTVEQIDMQLSNTHGAGDWGPGAAFAGSYARTFTVTDDATGLPIPGVSVQVEQGAAWESKQTSVLGIVTFQLDAGDYTYAVTSGLVYEEVTGTLTVAAAGDTAVSLVANVISHTSEEGKLTGWLPLYDAQTEIDDGATLKIRQYDAVAKRGMPATERTWTANAQGIASGTIWDGEHYQIKMGSGEWGDVFEAVDDADEANPQTMRLPGIKGL